jgi:hypothetical protein
MKSLRSFGVVFGAVLVLGVPGRLVAQQPDAWVLPRGYIEIDVGGQYIAFGERFGRPGVPRGAREPLGAELRAVLGPSNVPALDTLRVRLNQAFAATEAQAGQPGFRASPEQVVFGETGVRHSGDLVRVPFRIGAGVAPRLSVSISTALTQETATLQRYALVGAALGPNPDATYNRQVLERIDPTLAALGGSPWLPLAGSPVGQELQARVRASTASDSLRLPTRGADVDELRRGLPALGLPPLQSDEDLWRVADLELGARVLLVDGLGGAAYPTASQGVAFRTAAEAALRLPAGGVPRIENPLLRTPEQGYSGFSLRLDNDLFLAQRFWATASASYARLGAAALERPVLAAETWPAQVLPVRRLEHSPGDVLRVDLVPRFRIVDALSIGAHYSWIRVGDESFTGTVAGELPTSALDVPGHTVQRLGLGLRYSTLPAHQAGMSLLPLEAHFGYSVTISGAEGALAERRAEIRGVLYHRLWGRGR